MNKRPKIEDWESGKIEIPDDEYVSIFHSFWPFPWQELMYFVGVKTGLELGPRSVLKKKNNFILLLT